MVVAIADLESRDYLEFVYHGNRSIDDPLAVVIPRLHDGHDGRCRQLVFQDPEQAGSDHVLVADDQRILRLEDHRIDPRFGHVLVDPRDRLDVWIFVQNVRDIGTEMKQFCVRFVAEVIEEMTNLGAVSW
jgi:hypothetical protein